MKEKRIIENFNENEFYLYDLDLGKWSTCEVLNQDPFEYPLDIIKVKKENGKVSNEYFKLVDSIDDFLEDGCVYKIKLT